VAMSGVIAVVDSEVGEVLGSVLHNDGCIRRTPLHRNEEESPWSDDSLKRSGGHRHGDVEWWCRWTNGGADWSSSYAWSRGSTGTCARGERDRQESYPWQLW
jgi:hypothetical protein